MADGSDTPQVVTSDTPASGESAAPRQEAPSVGGELAAAEVALNDKLSKVYDALTTPAQKPDATKAAADTAAPSESVDATSSDQPTSSGPEPAQSSPAIVAPLSWSADVKDDWAKIPPKAQELIARRESEAHKAITQMGNELKTFEPLREIYSALNQHWRVPQGREPEVIASWARAQHALDTNPVEALKWLAQSYGVDISQMAGGKPADTKPAGNNPTGDPALDDLFKDPRIDQQLMPMLQAFQKKIEEQDQALRYFYGQQTARESADQTRRQKHASEVIGTFAKDKPYFAELEDEITDEVRLLKGREPDLAPDEVLKRAYDRAVWKSEPVRARILDEQRKAEETKSKQEATKKAAEAKKLNSMNVRSGTSAPSATTKGRFLDDDALSATYDRLNAG